MALDQATKTHIEKELLPFLAKDARIDLKSVAIRYLLEMTGSKEGRDFLAEGDKYIKAIVVLMDDKEKDIISDSYLTLINLTTEDKISWKIMDVEPTLMHDLLFKMLDSNFELADKASSIIANATRVPNCARKLANQVLEEGSKVSVENIVNVLCKINFNKNATLHYLALILSNLSQVSDIRKRIMDKDRCIIQKLIPFTEYSDSVIRRGGVLGTLKNCCFEYDYHPWLLSEEVDILARLLLPLAGGDEFDDDDMEKLPVDLQYLPPDKKREEDPDLRTILCEAIHQLCATKQGRLLVKAKNAYVILRELDKWEQDPQSKTACRKLIELIIQDEPAPDMEELHKVTLPEHLLPQLEQMDLDLISDIKSELNVSENEEKENKAVES